ncbi:MAG: hypothetical protein AAB509_03665 [Patescibacteria group bacterium]
MQKQKGISTLIGIIIIVAVAIVAFGGIFVYQYFTVKPQPDIQTAETAGWKTYTNTKYTFEIKYPDDFKGSVSADSAKAGLFFYGENPKKLKIGGTSLTNLIQNL